MACSQFFTRAWLLSILISIALVSFQVAVAQKNTASFPDGLWLTKKKDTAVRIEPCGKALCGYISWLRPDVDQVTPDGKPLCDTRVLWDFVQDTSHPDVWKGGKIFRANKGKVYSGRITVHGPDAIELRGYLGLPFIGKSYRLTRVRETSYPPCSS